MKKINFFSLWPCLVFIATFISIFSWHTSAATNYADNMVLLNKSSVNKIILCEENSSFDNPWLQPIGVVITNNNDIAMLYNELSNQSFTNCLEAPFVGILCYQVFLSKHDEVLAITHIVNFEATVVLQKGKIINQRYYVVNTGKAADIYRVCESIKFCRMIYEYLKKYRPDFVAVQNKYYLDVAHKTLEEMLFPKPESISQSTIIP